MTSLAQRSSSEFVRPCRAGRRSSLQQRGARCHREQSEAEHGPQLVRPSTTPHASRQLSSAQLRSLSLSQVLSCLFVRSPRAGCATASHRWPWLPAPHRAAPGSSISSRQGPGYAGAAVSGCSKLLGLTWLACAGGLEGSGAYERSLSCLRAACDAAGPLVRLLVP